MTSFQIDSTVALGPTDLLRVDRSDCSGEGLHNHPSSLSVLNLQQKVKLQIRINRSTDQRVNGSMDQWINGSMDQWINESMNQ